MPIPETMLAAVFDGELRLVRRPVPVPPPGWGLVRVDLAGVCRTDLEILKGYMGFTGVPGHEFVGTILAAEDESRIGERVVGEINAACGNCDWCARDLGRHCPSRTTLGIDRLDGCFAEYCMLPMANLLPVPDGMANERAVFVEPLSAACEILEQVPVSADDRVVVLGDGRLGILCAWVLATVCPHVLLVGRHEDKLAKARWRDLRTCIGPVPKESMGADIVVEATGRPEGLGEAIACCRPRGTIVLKSTIVAENGFNLSPVVVAEQTIVGSRCGRFQDGLAMLETYPDLPLERLISAQLPLAKVGEAIALARKGALKVLVAPTKSDLSD
jgi:alcohol dehydrogenase